jgi:hypothetical protein
MWRASQKAAHPNDPATPAALRKAIIALERVGMRIGSKYDIAMLCQSSNKEGCIAAIAGKYTPG